MKYGNPTSLGPSLLVAAAIMGSTLIAVLTSDLGWRVLAAPLVLVLAGLGADIWASRQRGGPPRPSATELMHAGSILLACCLLAAIDPWFVALLLPVFGATVGIPLRRKMHRRMCAST